MAEDKNDILERAKAYASENQSKERATEIEKSLNDMLKTREEILARINMFQKDLAPEEFYEKLKSVEKAIVAIQGSIEKSSALEDMAKSADTVAEKLGGLLNLQKDYNETLTSSVVASMGSAEGQAKLAESMKKTFTASNIAAMAIQEVIVQSIELTKAQDDALVQFARNGGNIKLYKTELKSLERSLFTTGVTSAEAGEAFLAVNNVFTDLRNVSKSARTDIVRTTAILQELGVAGDVTASNIQFMTKVLGTSAEQASHTQRELFLLARTIDMPPEAMATAFQDAMPALAAFGSESTEVFKRLQVNARAAGMEVSDVLSIVEQFDTFDGAAQAVGRLNAILGGPFLNSLEMVTTTDPTERMKMLSGAVNDAGLAFDDMSYYQRKALADAMGMDIPQLALLMRDGFDQAVPSAQMSQAEMAKLAEEAAEFQTVMDELKQTGMLLAQSLMPLVDVIKMIANGIQTLTTSVPGFTDKVIPPLVIGIGILTLGMKKLKKEFHTMGPIAAVISLALFMMSDASLGAKIAVGSVTVAVMGLTAAYLGLNVASGGLIWALGAIAAAMVTIAGIIFHKSASPGLIDANKMLGESFNGLASDLGGTANAFGSLGGEMINAAQAAHKLDGTKVEMQTKVTASSTATGGSASSRIRTASDQQTISRQGSMANQASGPSSQSNVNIKVDDGSLVKAVVKITEEVINNRDSGLRSNPNVIQNRVLG